MAAPPAPPRAWTVLWFPFFFAAAFSLTAMLSFASPAPRDVEVVVVATPARADAVADALDQHRRGGFDVIRGADASSARAAVAAGDAAAAYVVGDTTADLVVASAASPTRAGYLERTFAEAIGPALGLDRTAVSDVVPASAGDVSGVGLFFFGLPLLLVGMITSIVLLQLAAWTTWRRAGLLAATGAFAVAFSFVLAVRLDVLPAEPWLLPLGFVLTQAIGWGTSAVSVLVKRFFMPISMTFVLVLGIPTAGGTVNADMLPPFLAALHTVLPFGQFIDATRAVAYFDGRGALPHVAVLLTWLAVGAALLGLAHRRHRPALAHRRLDRTTT